MGLPSASMSREYNPGQSPAIHLSIAIGSSGAVTSWKGQGVRSVTKESADGTYTIQLEKAYASGPTFFSYGFYRPAGAELSANIDSFPTASSIDLELRVNAGTPTDATSGDIVYLCFIYDEQGIVQ